MGILSIPKYQIFRLFFIPVPNQTGMDPRNIGNKIKILINRETASIDIDSSMQSY